MAFPKNEVFDPDDQEIGRLGRALGHPARASILRILDREGPLFVYQIVRLLPISEGAVTEHLKKLRTAGLLQVRVFGLYNLYALNPDGLQRMYERQTAYLRVLLEAPKGEADGGAQDGKP
jgi:DNA-binding transcriptional ArsR family regulator